MSVRRRSMSSAASTYDPRKLDYFEKLDKKRKGVLHTQACDGTWHLLLSVTPSVLPYVLGSVDFWLSVFVYVLARIMLVFDWVQPAELGEFRGLATMGFLLALMLSFYVNIAVSRLFETNKHAMSLIREINDVAMLMRSYVWKTDEQQDTSRRCVDYMCAAMVHGFIGFSRPYTAENLWEGFNEEFGCVTQQEEALILAHRENGGSRMRELLSWALQGLSISEGNGWIAAPIAAELNISVTKFMDSCQELYDFRYLPIPFVLEHLLVLFVHIYLPIQTFEMAVQTAILHDATQDVGTMVIIEVFGCLLALLANIGFQGLFAVGAFLEEPYGDGICHARVSTFCRLACKEARRILDSGSPWSNTPPKEERKAKVEKLTEVLRSRGLEDPGVSVGLRYLQEQAKQVEQHNQDSSEASQSQLSETEEDDDKLNILSLSTSLDRTIGTNILSGIAVEPKSERCPAADIDSVQLQMVDMSQANADLLSALNKLTSILSSTLNDGIHNGHREKIPRIGDKQDRRFRPCSPGQRLCDCSSYTLKQGCGFKTDTAMS